MTGEGSGSESPKQQTSSLMLQSAGAAFLSCDKNTLVWALVGFSCLFKLIDTGTTGGWFNFSNLDNPYRVAALPSTLFIGLMRCLSLTGSMNFGVILDIITLGREHHQSCGANTGLKIKHRCLASDAVWHGVYLPDKDTLQPN